MKREQLLQPRQQPLCTESQSNIYCNNILNTDLLNCLFFSTNSAKIMQHFKKGREVLKMF